MRFPIAPWHREPTRGEEAQKRELTGEEIVNKGSYYPGTFGFDLPASYEQRKKALDYLETIGFNPDDWMMDAKGLEGLSENSSVWLYSKKYIQAAQRRRRIKKTIGILFEDTEGRYRKATHTRIQYLRFDED